MLRQESTPLLETALLVGDRASQLFRRYFDQSHAAELDYISVFTKSEDEYDELCRQAELQGEQVFHKNGNVYRLTDETAAPLTTAVIRVRTPSKSDLIGCADFVVANYPQARQLLVAEQGYKEQLKGSYHIIEVEDSVLQVAMYVPSQRLTHTLMDL